MPRDFSDSKRENWAFRIEEFGNLEERAEAYLRKEIPWKGLTPIPFACKIGCVQSSESKQMRILSSVDRAFGSEPKGRRFDSCRVQRKTP